MKRFLPWCTIFLAAGLLTACSDGSSGPRVPAGNGTYTNISTAELNSMLGQKDFMLINVHIPYEGEIEQTDLFIAYNKIEENLAQLPRDKQAKIVVYCRSGAMSATASRTLVELGYTNVFNLSGGMIGWERAGFELKRKAQIAP